MENKNDLPWKIGNVFMRNRRQFIENYLFEELLKPILLYLHVQCSFPLFNEVKTKRLLNNECCIQLNQREIQEKNNMKMKAMEDD